MCESLGRQDFKVERISNPVNDIKIGADIDSILDSLVAHPRHAHWSNVILPNISRCQCQLFQKSQRSPQFLIDWGRAPIIQNRLDECISERLRRDRAVTPRSKGTLVRARDKRSEKLAFANAPIGRPAHHIF